MIDQNSTEKPSNDREVTNNPIRLLITLALRQPTAIALSLSLLLFLLTPLWPQSANFTCGSSLKTYRVTKPLSNTTEGVRCVKFGKGNIQNGLPAFSWFGEGTWGKLKYRHLGHAFEHDTNRFTGYAADFSGNGENTNGHFNGTLKIEFSNDRVGTTPKKITVKEDKDVWDEEWKLEEDNNLENYRSRFINSEISTCGGLNSGFTEEPITDSVVRCTLKFQPQALLLTSDSFTWYEEGKRHGVNYARIGTLDDSEYKISDICKRAKFIGHCQLKSLVK